MIFDLVLQTCQNLSFQNGYLKLVLFFCMDMIKRAISYVSIQNRLFSVFDHYFISTVLSSWKISILRTDIDIYWLLFSTLKGDWVINFLFIVESTECEGTQQDDGVQLLTLHRAPSESHHGPDSERLGDVVTVLNKSIIVQCVFYVWIEVYLNLEIQCS